MRIPAVSNYTGGSWWSSPDGQVVADAVTGEPFVTVSSDGLDAEKTIALGRGAGRSQLLPLGFHRRAGLVRAVALALKERRDELVELSARYGATEADASVDVDGAIGTALVFASIAAKGLPEGNVWPEDCVVPLGRGGTFGGRHLLTPRAGVAVQVNAFNFPVWGMVEKLAPALVAGVATIVKPATQTAYVAERAVRIIVEAGVLPEAALQLVCGRIDAVLDLLDAQDLLSFTGSARTAATLRRHPAVAERAARFNAETDSLNASVLGPDAVPGTVEFDLFLAGVLAEMTCKAGQRCTAIRRALVPQGLVGAVVEGLAAGAASVVVGAPGHADVTMGALAGPDQREDVLVAIGRLTAAAGVVCGGGVPADVVGADARRGAFVAPTVLVADDAAAPAVHQVEAFGPVVSVLGYRDVPQAAELLALGGGSLVASLVSGDETVIRDLVTATAPYHGRLLVLDADCAAESTGHGTPMPQLVHGGPGRAGGGEEEGGLRAVAHCLQRTAVQGSPRVLEALTASPLSTTDS